jgi:hypothetical protein
MIGARFWMAMVCILVIFRACASDRDPPNTVKSLADQPSVDGSPAGDDAVSRNSLARHAKLCAAMLDEHVELLERSLVEQYVDSFPGGELAARVLSIDALLATAEPGIGSTLLKLLEDLVHLPLLRSAG